MLYSSFVALTSASTYADALAQYRDSAGYNRSSLSAAAALSMAEDFAEAIRHMLTAPSASAFQDTSMAYRPDLWQKELDRVDAFIDSSSANSNSGGVRKFSFANARA